MLFQWEIRWELRKAGANSFGFFFVSGLGEESKHVTFVVFHARLVERINAENVSADTASLFKEVNKLTDAVFTKGINSDADVRNATIDVCDACAKLRHLVDLINTTRCNVIESVKVSFVRRDNNVVSLVNDRDNGFKDSAFTVLNPLSHRVKVCRVIDRSGENAFVVFALRFTVKLFPPFSEEVKFRIIVN